MSRKKKKDPFADREAAKYPNPIPSREFIIEHLLARKVPGSLRELTKELALITDDAKEALRRRLKAMLRDGQLEQLTKRRFWPIGRRMMVEGVVFIDKKNMIWVRPDDRSSRIALPKYQDKRVFQGNRVIVSVPDVTFDKQPREGKLVEILEQPNLVITGRFVKDAGFCYVIPHSKEIVQDILIPQDKENDAEDGHIVVVEIMSQQSRWSDPIGHVIEVLGDEHSKGIEIEAAIRAHNLPYRWPEEVKQQITNLKETVSTSAKRDRVDLRELPLVTIDGEDARDFDDAVFCEPKKGGGWRLYVAIADVSYYVKPNTALDKEARERGNSVYFPTKVIPMLPEVLSNGLCSLKPEVDRLCMVCEMSISKSGKLTRYEFYEGVMHSHARLTYTKVAKILDGDEVLRKQYEGLVDDLESLQDLYTALRSQRVERGAIDFETVETRILFGKNGKIRDIEPIERNVAHRIIEECMLCANVATARFLDKHKIPGLYRNHEGPPEDKLTDLRTFLNELGLSLGKGGKGNKPKPLDYGELLKKIQNRPDANVIQTVLLRSLCQAVYSPDNLGHFGLAYPAYTHFTSPIRRYPDLIVHRQIRSVLRGKWNANARDTKAGAAKVEKIEKDLASLAHHCSVTERKADDATRDVILSLKCQYMQQHVGKIFEGVISGVTRFGFFVELKDIYIDGLVHMNNLDNDYFVYDQVHHKLTGERTGVEYSLGTLVTVCVAKVDVDERKIDFTLEKSEKRIRRSMKKAFEKKIKKKKSKQEETKPGKKAKLKSSKKLKPKSAKTKKTKAKRK